MNKILKILGSGGATLNCALLVVTTILWVSAILLPSWFVFSSGLYRSVSAVGETHVGLFYVYQCVERWCWQSFSKTGNRNYDSVIPDLLELQIESISALLLCALSCIVLLIPMKSTPKSTSARFLIVSVILPVACNTLFYILSVIPLQSTQMNYICLCILIISFFWRKAASIESRKQIYLNTMQICILIDILDIILIIRATLAYKEMSASFKEWETQPFFSLLKVEMKFPSSILLSGIGTVFAIMSWFISIVMYRMSRRSHVQNMGDGIFMSKK